jgi:integrase
VSKARIANARSLLARALELAGVREPNRPAAEVVSPGWQDHLRQVRDRYWRTTLCPFARFATFNGVEPHQVSDEVMERYRDHLEKVALVSKPRTTHQTLCRIWNKAAQTIPAWPKIAVRAPSYTKRFSLERERFPKSFTAELDVYLARLGHASVDDLFDLEAPDRALRLTSVRAKRYQIMQAASALVFSGFPLIDVTSLAVLVTPDNFVRSLKHLHGRPRRDQDSTRTLGLIADTLRAMAKYWVKVPEDDLEKLRLVTKRLNRPNLGMTDANRAKLAPFEDPAVHRRFLRVGPEGFVAICAKKRFSRRDAVTASLLLGLEILLHAPLRVGNLAALAFGESVILPDEEGETVLTIGAGEVKNDRPLFYVLPPYVTQLLKFHRDHLKPLLDTTPSPFLFPGDPGKHKRADTLSKQLSSLVRQRTGLMFSPHLARHLSGTKLLDARPGDYECVRQLLGHKSIETAHKYYLFGETRTAARLHHKLIEAERGPVPDLPLPPRRRKPRRAA